MKCVLFTPASQPAVIITSSPSQQTFPVSERSEKQVRFLCAGGSGVWASCRLDPILRLFDWSTGRPLQEIDFSVLVTKTLGTTKAKVLTVLVQMNKMWLSREHGAALSPSGQAFLTLSPLQISSLAVISSRLWVGTGGGALFSIPLSISKTSPWLVAQAPFTANPILCKRHQLSAHSIGSGLDPILLHCIGPALLPWTQASRQVHHCCTW